MPAEAGAPHELGSGVGLRLDAAAVCPRVAAAASERRTAVLVYIEYISRLPSVSVEQFHFAAGTRARLLVR